MIFVCDTMLGRLAKYLRMLGLDTVYIKSPSMRDVYMKDSSSSYFFTRRKGWKASEVNFIYIESDNVIAQLNEIKDIIRPHVDAGQVLKRCVKCNRPLNSVGKDDIESLVPEFIFHSHNVFKTCPLCRKVYWDGSHVEHMRAMLKEIIL